MAHVTIWPRGLFWRSGTEFGGLGRARSGMGSRLGAEMTSSNRKCYHGNRDEPEMEKKLRDTLMDRFEQNFNGFLHV